METTIIKVTSQEKTELCQLYREFIADTHASNPPDLEDKFDTFIQSTVSHMNIIYADGIPAGFVEYRELPNKLRDKQGIIEITSLFTRAAYRNLGIGKQLVESVGDYAQENNFGCIVLYSGLELLDAHKFYEKIGFKKKAFYFAKVLS